VTVDTTIVCAGTLSQVTCYYVRSLTLEGYGEPVTSRTVLGNDAVMVGRLLSAAGTPAACLLLSPSNSDVALLRATAPDLTVLTAGLRQGMVTTSSVLQAADGRRYWLLPPAQPGTMPTPRTVIGPLVYADMYDEFEDTMIAWLTAARPSGLIVNLSGSRHREKAARLAPLRPLLVQAATSHVRSGTAVPQAARELQSLARAEHALLSAGPLGFALTGPGEQIWTRAPEVPLSPAPGLGAGAAVSAGLLHGLAHGLNAGALADTACDWAESYLRDPGQ